MSASNPTPPSSLQDRYAPLNRCFGCGPANTLGLRLKSQVEGNGLWAEFTPQPHHEAFEGILNGGIIATLLDCHGNWAATHHLMQRDGLDRPPCTVTASLEVKLRRPTPSRERLRLWATVTESGADRATVEAHLECAGLVTATCLGVFVAVKEGHPAFHRW
jgi:acyl-coenzyme A thioesterase PaaI-like protein